MKRSELEKHLGRQVTVTLFDGDKISGFLYKTGDARFKNYPNLYMSKNWYVLLKNSEDSNSAVDSLFRCSHVIKISRR